MPHRAAPWRTTPRHRPLQVRNTTPSAVQSQQILYGMQEAGAAAVVMEVTSIGLDQGRTEQACEHIAWLLGPAKGAGPAGRWLGFRVLGLGACLLWRRRKRGISARVCLALAPRVGAARGACLICTALRAIGAVGSLLPGGL